MENLTGGKASVLKRCGAFVAVMVWRLSRRPKLVLVCAEGPPTMLCIASSSVEGKKGNDKKHPFPLLLAEVPKLSLPRYCQ